MDEFTKRLIAIQQEQKLSDGAMADYIGCSRQHYQMVRTGLAGLGLIVVRGALQAFAGDKELIKHAAEWLANDPAISTGKETV